MDDVTAATSRVAHFDIHCTQYLRDDGAVLAPLPEWARDAEALRQLYRAMVVTRAFDKKAVALQRTGRLGTYASCLGQEAIGAAIGMALRPEDVFMPAYREYAAQFLRGVKMRDVLLCWGGDERGMAFADSPIRHDFPMSVPIGSQVPQALGVAYALQLRGEARVALVCCGDGASSKGDVAEAISAAGIWRLPLVFVISNNQWAISLPRAQQTGAETLAQKAIAGGIAGEQVDGNDVIATRTVLARAIERARSGHGPALIEALTYRLHDHTTADDARRYRSEDEVREAWQRCPVARLQRYLTQQSLWTPHDEDALQRDAQQQADDAAQEFLATAPDTPAAMFEHLYASLPRQLAWQRQDALDAAAAERDHG